jgi:hypothetical protein
MLHVCIMSDACYFLTGVSCPFIPSAGKLKGTLKGQLIEHDCRGHCMRFT